MNDLTKKCLVCEQDEKTVPLIPILYNETQYYICPGHLPILIHHPEKLTDQLPGAANITPHQH
jgi:hypothetical protein